MFDEMRAALTAGRARARDPRALGTGQVLELATLGGARALGLDSELGSLRVGKRADLAILSFAGSSYVPWEDPVSAIVLDGRPERIVATFVDGERRYTRGGNAWPDTRSRASRARSRMLDARPVAPRSASIEDTMFFPRFRRHAKWVFVLLALIFGLGFVVFGVGAGGTGIGDILRGDNSGSGGSPSVKKALAATEKTPNDPEAWRELSTAYQTDGKNTEAIDALRASHHTSLRRHGRAPRARRPLSRRRESEELRRPS